MKKITENEMSMISGSGWREWVGAALGGAACGLAIAGATMTTAVTLGVGSPTLIGAFVVCGSALTLTT